MKQKPIRHFLRPTRPWVWLISLFVVYTLGLALVATLLLEHQAKKFAQERLDSTANFGAIKINPYALSLELSEVEISDNSGQLLSFENLYVDFQLFSYLRSRLIDFRTIDLSTLVLNLNRNPDGDTNIQALIDRFNQTAPPQDAIEGAAEVSAAPINLLLRNLTITESSIQLRDRQPQTPMTIAVENIEFQLNNLSLSGDQAADIELAFDLSSGGSLNLEAALVASPEIDLQMQFEIVDTALLPLQSYIAETTQIDLDSGLLNLSGEVLSSTEEPFSYRGDLSINGLDLQYEGESLLSWQQMLLPDNYFSISENRLEISEIILNDAYAKTEIYSFGGNNVSMALSSPNPNADSSAPDANDANKEIPEQSPTTPVAISIGKIEINTAQMHFADFSLPLPFVANISDLNGSVSTISNSSSEPAELDLEGEVGEFGLVEMQGRLRPLNYQDLTQIDLSFSNISMMDLSPYLIKFVGRTIDSGKMDVDLSYLIEAGQLQGNNTMVLSDFRLGESVESPDAMNLPLGLAVALLKNADGVIDIELPVSGDLGSPEFSYGRVIRTALTNLITNIISSPFRLLGGLIGSEEPLDNVEFNPGSYELRPPEREKLLKLSKALAQRPQLALYIPAVYDSELDSFALRQRIVAEKIERGLSENEDSSELGIDRRVGVLESLAAQLETPPDLNLLRAEYSDALDANNTNQTAESQLDRPAYARAIEQILVASESIALSQLEDLAGKRALAVKAYLDESQAGLSNRIFIALEATVLEAENSVLEVPLELEGLP